MLAPTKPDQSLAKKDIQEKELLRQTRELARQIRELGYESKGYRLASPFGIIPAEGEDDTDVREDPRLVTLKP